MNFQSCIVILNLVIFGFIPCICEGSERLDGRYSFSLTTFSPTGKLVQVERALEATALLGTPVVAICRRQRRGQQRGRDQLDTDHDLCNSYIVMASPQVLPSPLLMNDDGTARFARVSPQIVVAHSGLSADGRVVVAAAQRLAVEHAYTFNEAIPIELFLEEVSLLFQEYTMKAASRPFGVTLLVGYIPSIDDGDDDERDSLSPQLYRIHTSGAVESLGCFGLIGNAKLSEDMTESLQNLASKTDSTLEEDRSELVNIIKSAITNKKSKESKPNYLTILSAAVSQDQFWNVRRHD